MNEFQENVSKWLNEIRKTGQNMKSNFKKQK
jgi:hypothetical protein